MQKARCQAFPLRGIALQPLVGMWFQVQCPPLVGVLPIFRSRYSFAIGHQRVLSLSGWSPPIRTHFHVLSRTQDSAWPPGPVAYGTLTLCGRRFHAVQLRQVVRLRSYNPAEVTLHGLGSSAFAR